MSLIKTCISAKSEAIPITPKISTTVATGRNKIPTVYLPCRNDSGINSSINARKKFRKLSKIWDNIRTNGEILKLLSRSALVVKMGVHISSVPVMNIHGSNPPKRNNE